MSQIKEDHPDVALCASYVMGLPDGIRRADLAKLLGCSEDKTNRLLAINRRLGVLELYARHWVEPKFYVAMRANMIAQAKTRKKANDTKIKLAKRLEERKLKLAIEQAKENPEVKLHAPNSVWQLRYFV